jgi:hypothetical protein
MRRPELLATPFPSSQVCEPRRRLPNVDQVHVVARPLAELSALVGADQRARYLSGRQNRVAQSASSQLAQLWVF